MQALYYIVTDYLLPRNKAIGNHISQLQCHVHMQVEYKRLQLLRHPLVKDFLFHKFWLVTFPLFLAYLLLYCLFLVFITSFALVSPRPGPGSETCKNGLH